MVTVGQAERLTEREPDPQRELLALVEGQCVVEGQKVGDTLEVRQGVAVGVCLDDALDDKHSDAVGDCVGDEVEDKHRLAVGV